MKAPRNGYTVYPYGNYAKSLTAANKLAKTASKRSGSAYVDNNDTEATVSRWRDGKRQNPGRKMTKRKRKNAPRRNSGTKSKLLKNFTGVVRLNKDKTVSIIGTGKKANPARKRTKRRAKR
jgi:hypothetical protein